MWEGIKQSVIDEANALDKLITATVNERVVSGKRIFCKAGCSGCCTLYVQTTLTEALIISDLLTPEQWDRLCLYIEVQQKTLNGIVEMLTLLRLQRSIIGPCPFLDKNGYCSIYAQRPLACRALLSTKPAEWCSVDFSKLETLEKQLYLDSLEHSVVSYPVHYLSLPQIAAQKAEERIVSMMKSSLGVAVSGNLPWLVYHARTCDISAQIKMGKDQWIEDLCEVASAHPLLLQVTPFI